MEMTVTDEDAFKSLEIYLTRFKLKELELTYLFDKTLKEFRSIGLQGAELWPFKEGQDKGCTKIKATGCITETRPYGSLNSAM